MPLPHYTQAKASVNNFEPVYPNLFEVTLLTPNNDDSGLILQHVTSVSGLDILNPNIDAVGQKYKFSDRSYAGMPAQTFVDITINFTVNLNDSNEAYIYNSLRDWYKLVYDPQTGEMGLKRDYVGSGVIVQYNRAGDIFRRITLRDMFPTGQLTFLNELKYETQDAATVSQVYRCDHWLEENVGA